MSFVSAIGRRLVLAALFVLALSPSVRSDELAHLHAAVEEGRGRVSGRRARRKAYRSDAARPLTAHAILLLKAETCVSRRDVDEAQLHPLDAVPAIEAQGAGGVHPLTTALPERDPQFLSGRAKRDGIDDRPVA